MVSWLKALFLDWSRGFKNSQEISTLSQELSSVFLSLSITHINTHIHSKHIRTHIHAYAYAHTYMHTHAHIKRERGEVREEAERGREIERAKQVFIKVLSESSRTVQVALYCSTEVPMPLSYTDTHPTASVYQ